MTAKAKKDTSLNHLYDFLRQFKLSDSLYIISCINAALKYGTSQLAEVNIPPYIKLWLGRIPKEHRRYLQLNLDVSRVARFLLLSGSNDYKNKTLNIPDGSINKAMSLVGELYDTDIETKPEEVPSASRILGRISQWQFPLQTERDAVIGRAYLLYYILPAELKLEYSLEDKMQEYFQIGAFEFMSTGLALWFNTNGILDYELNIEIDYLKKVVSPSSMLRFLELSSGTFTDYKKAIRGENWKTMNKLFDVYFLDPLIKMPAIKVEHSLKLRKGTYLVPNAKYLLDRASNGVFYLLSDYEQQIGIKAGKHKQNPFRTAFGDIYRAYVGKQLMQHTSEFRLIDLDKEIQAPKGRLIPDFALINETTCVLFEVKLSLLTLTTRTFFNDIELLREVTGGNIKKAISQLDDFRQLVLSQNIIHSNFKNIKRVIILLIGYEDIFIANASLLPLLKNEYCDMAKDLQLGCISDIEAIGNALEKQVNVVNLLEEKIDDVQYETYALSNYLEEKCGRNNKLLRNSFDDYINHLIHGASSK